MTIANSSGSTGSGTQTPRSIEEQFFEFLGMLGRLAFYLPPLSINVDAKFPGILTERASLARLICRYSAYRLWF
jgi:hypothetical protein